MASEYSQLVTSFEREGRFPLEADYVFGTEGELAAWLEDGIHAATAHEGLLKVVLSDPNGEQGLYWVVTDVDGVPSFRELAGASELEALKALGEATLSGEDSLRAQIRAVVGCGDGEDIMDVLSGLSHGSLKGLSEALDKVDEWIILEGD